jgi:hypothetical protein
MALEIVTLTPGHAAYKRFERFACVRKTLE